MSDIEAPIIKPVALPRRVFGAPELPATFSMVFSVFVFIGLVMFDPGIDVTVIVLTFLGALIGGHIILVQLGARDPHLTSLIQTMRFAIRTPRNIGRLRRKIYHP